VAATPKEVGSSPATTRQRDWGVAANLFLLFLFYFKKNKFYLFIFNIFIFFLLRWTRVAILLALT
jgi:hypothetical protein